jgi:putative ABC transport system ATP-binding protein
VETSPAILLDRVSKRYGGGAHAVNAVQDVSLEVPAGEFISVMGPSGSGKSTLLNLIAGLDTPTSGRVIVAGEELARLSDDERSRLRLRHVGFVFQAFNLFPTFTVEENVAWPLEFLGHRWSDARQRAGTVLARVGVDATARRRRPAELSAASSSASPSHARSRPSPTCSSPTSRRGTSTRRPGSRSSTCSGR